MTLGIYAMMFGRSYHWLHRRFLDAVPKEASLNLWLNDVPDETRTLAAGRGRVHDNGAHNTGKAKVFTWWRQTGMPEDWVMCLDDDTLIVAPDWYAHTAAFLAKENPACFGAVVTKFGEELLHGSFFGVRRDVLESLAWPDPGKLDGKNVHGFPNEHYGVEDDLARKLKAAGHKLTPYWYGVAMNTLSRGMFKPY